MGSFFVTGQIQAGFSFIADKGQHQNTVDMCKSLHGVGLLASFSLKGTSRIPEGTLLSEAAVSFPLISFLE